jgi:hypothetical protein
MASPEAVRAASSSAFDGVTFVSNPIVVDVAELTGHVPPAALGQRTLHAGGADVIDQIQVDTVVDAPGLQ